MRYLLIFLITFGILSISRFIPHPPNFTPLVMLSFYLPIYFGRNTIFLVIISLAITDLIIGFHTLLLFTWGSILIIGLISNYFKFSLITRLTGAVISVVIFSFITNVSSWLIFHGAQSDNLYNNFLAVLPFFVNNLMATLIFSAIFETVYKYYFFLINKKEKTK